MVDGEALVMMMAMISSNSPSWQGARTEFLTLQRGFAMAAEFHKSFVKSDYPPDVFRSEGLVERGPRGGAQGHHTMWWRDHGPTVPPRGVGGSLPPVSYSGFVDLRLK